MYYLDASAAVAAITDEPHSERIWNWLSRHDEAAVLVSGWVSPEIASALSIKLRTGALTLEDRAAAGANWRDLRNTSLGLLVVTDSHFGAASTFCDQHELGLRAGDALHLAIVASAGLTLLTFDRTMANAACQLGIPVEPL